MENMSRGDSAKIAAAAVAAFPEATVEHAVNGVGVRIVVNEEVVVVRPKAGGGLWVNGEAEPLASLAAMAMERRMVETTGIGVIRVRLDVDTADFTTRAANIVDEMVRKIHRVVEMKPEGEIRDAFMEGAGIVADEIGQIFGGVRFRLMR